MKQNKNDWIDALISGMTEKPYFQSKQIKAIDVMELLQDINNHPPESISQLNSIILNQQQYDIVITE